MNDAALRGIEVLDKKVLQDGVALLKPSAGTGGLHIAGVGWDTENSLVMFCVPEPSSQEVWPQNDKRDSNLHQRQQEDSENWDLLHFALKHWEPSRNLQTHTVCKSQRRMESRKKWFGVPIRACSYWTYFLAWRISENLFCIYLLHHV